MIICVFVFCLVMDWFLLPTGLTPHKEKQLIALETEKTVTPSPTPPLTDNLLSPTGLTPDREKRPVQLMYRVSRSNRQWRKLRMTEKFPEIVALTELKLRHDGYSAHHRRRSSTGVCGVSRSGLRKFVIDSMSFYQSLQVSVDTIHRIMKPPSRKRNAALLYTGQVEAKVPAKSNNFRKYSEDSHAYSARVRLVREFAAFYSKNVLILSCDNKNKVNVGVLATSRMQKINRFFCVDDNPDYNDHDFPLGYKITPMGYMILHQTDEAETFTDDRDRKMLKLSCNGPLYIFNRAPCISDTGVITPHITDLCEVIDTHKESRSIVALIVDNGSDYNLTCVTNILFLVRLWKQLKLDALIQVSYCPGYSAYNPIEHGWSICTRALTAVTLPAVLPGEILPPCGQTGLREEEVLAKERCMMSNAREILDSHWNSLTYNGFPVKSRSRSDGFCEIYDDYDQIKELLDKPTTARQNKPLIEELNFAMQHIDRRLDALIIKKCENAACSHCTEHPATAKDAMNFLRTYSSFPTPQQITASTSFKNFLETINSPPSQTRVFARKRFAVLRQRMGSVKCDVCPSYYFTSLADKNRHNRTLHPGKRNIISAR